MSSSIYTTLWPVVSGLSPEFVSNIKFFCVFSETGDNVIIVTKNDKVFAFGKNDFGCLGLGHYNVVQEPKVVNELCDKQIIDISYGSYHVLALTKTGKCYSWGKNGAGQLGNGTKIHDYKPKLINNLLHENVIQIACGFDHSFVLTNSGELYGFGYNGDGRIDCENTENQLNPIKIKKFNNEKIVRILCGRTHSIAVTNVQMYYSWGFNLVCQYGFGNAIHQKFPKKTNLNNTQIKKISCGRDHYLLLTTDGDIYAFGCNEFGQIGNGNKTNQLSPTKINSPQKFEDISCNHLLNISVAKADNDYCYVWGECEKKSFSTPQKTKMKSFNEVFAKYSKIKITREPIHLPSTNNILLKNILKLFNNPKNSDLKFKIEGKYIYVQKCILETNCKYFESKFKESTKPMRESTENKTREDIIEIKGYSYDVYYAFLNYLYTHSIDIEAEKVIDLLVLANDYKEEELKLKCVEIVKNSIP
jgi:alpha-tubulin suppressor-like RCC1 family protein